MVWHATHRPETALRQTISPMLDLTVMTALPACLVVIDDQAPIGLAQSA
jgi:hypothetical protein